MRTLLVLAPQEGLSDALRSILDAQEFRVLHHKQLWEAELLLSGSSIDLCVIDADLTSVQPIRTIEMVRRRLPHCPILVFAGNKQREWEEEAYLHGVSHVLSKPVRAALLNTLIERLIPVRAAKLESSPAPARAAAEPRATDEEARSTGKALEIVRDFSRILTHSLNAEPLLKQFLLFLRERLSVNRAAIYLRDAPGSVNEAGASESRRLRSSCAIGLPAGLLEHLELSLGAGIGGYLFRRARILRRDSADAGRDVEIEKEFELLGAQVAVPILDRESVLGVAVFDGRITGEPLLNSELELIFHLLEQLGLSIRNIWLHAQVGSSNEMMTDILRQLKSACIVIGRDLAILHANEAALSFFSSPQRAGLPLDFSALPQILGSKVFEVLQSGQELKPFKFSPVERREVVYQVTVTPFRNQRSTVPNAALMLVEDITQFERLRQLEIEAANLRLVKVMAERLSHEVGNALVPLSTHQQLLDENYEDPEFRESLSTALTEGVKRVSRLASQMLFLARDLPSRSDAIPIEQLIRDAFQDAQKHLPLAKPPKLTYENGDQPVMVAGDRASLKHALSEIILNAIQANPGDSRIWVRSSADTDPAGTNWIHLEIKDSGKGFTSEAAGKVPEPFFTTRNVGIGLGLTVSRKIIETHHGKLEIGAGEPSGVVRVSLPIATAG